MDISSGTPLYVGNGNGAMGGDWGIMFLAFLAMMGGGFGGWGNRGPMMPPMTGDQAPASSAQLQNAMNFNDLQDQNRDINNNVNNVYHDTIAYVGDKYMELQRNVEAVRTQAIQCSFETQKQISDQTLKFSEMMNAQNMMIVAENQKTRDLFVQDRFERMQAEINELKRQRDLAGLRDSLRPLPPPFPMAAGF
ncbi:MAG: hypothetical protein J6M63_11060 [Pseudobutyrivibrio sp.]|nr:hypothetical protein [Pseudobutyrivibrio sp.]MBP3622057.1 hypothetical protein [Lachnospiraceae bacterium]